MKQVFATWLLLSVLLASVFFLQFTTAQSYSPMPAPPSTPTAPPSFCNVKCGVRCSKSSRRRRCLKYCKLCCGVCNCVPPGTFGNKWHCPCYAKMLNAKGKPKCP